MLDCGLWIRRIYLRDCSCEQFSDLNQWSNFVFLTLFSGDHNLPGEQLMVTKEAPDDEDSCI